VIRDGFSNEQRPDLGWRTSHRLFPQVQRAPLPLRAMRTTRHARLALYPLVRFGRARGFRLRKSQPHCAHARRGFEFTRNRIFRGYGVFEPSVHLSKIVERRAEQDSERCVNCRKRALTSQTNSGLTAATETESCPPSYGCRPTERANGTAYRPGLMAPTPICIRVRSLASIRALPR
jgi:hypothetical protein